jgi:hypothetical protein
MAKRPNKERYFLKLIKFSQDYDNVVMFISF